MAYKLDRSRRKSLILKQNRRSNSQEALVFNEGFSKKEISGSNLNIRDQPRETSDHILLADSVGTRDLATLATLTEDSVIAELKKRYDQNVIYTNIGDILIAINPFKPIAGLYGEMISVHHYPHQPLSNLPHVFRISQAAYKNLLISHKNQCCVISGESGAGKTETAKYLVEHLLSMCKGSGKLEERIMQVNPLLEAFGNAKTVINDNSSRFGKYLDIKFGFYGEVLGASLSEYLLEKSRVVRQGDGERNFHVFYYLFSSKIKEAHNLKPVTEYHYLRGGTSGLTRDTAIDVNDVALKESYEHLIQCMDDVGFSNENVESVFDLLGVILQLGGIEFEEGDDGFSKYIKEEAVEKFADISGVDLSELTAVLQSTSSVTRGEKLYKNYSVPDAYGNRDAMAKAMYGRLFGWIVTQANNLLKPKGDSYREACGREGGVTDIGILDIFGFENFEHNSFEQLCINIANEQLQFYFNQHIFAWELAAYAKEGIDSGSVTYNDNRDLLDMLLQKPLGIFALLDEESRFPNSTPESLVDKISAAAVQCEWTHYKRINITSRKQSVTNNRSNKGKLKPGSSKSPQPKSFRGPKGNEDDNGPVFEISHYAGPVQYDSAEFLVKNRDNLSKDVLALYKTSDKPFLRRLFQQISNRTGTFHSNGTASRRLMANNKLSVSAFFKNSLLDLMDKMLKANPHFVRCIKPNTQKLPGHFVSDKVAKQLLYAGVVETTRIRRDGFAVRMGFKDFVLRYHGLGLSVYDMPNFSEEDPSPVEEVRLACSAIIEATGLRGVQLGTSLVFLKYYHHDKLVLLLDEMNKKVTTVNTSVRVWLAKRRLAALREERDRAIAAAKLKAEQERRAAELRARIEAEKAAAAEIERLAAEAAAKQAELEKMRQEEKAATMRRERVRKAEEEAVKQMAAEQAAAAKAAREATERLEREEQEVLAAARRQEEEEHKIRVAKENTKRLEAEEREQRRKAQEQAEAEAAREARAAKMTQLQSARPSEHSAVDKSEMSMDDFAEFLNDEDVDPEERQRLAQLAAQRRAEEHQRKLRLKIQHEEEEAERAKARMQELDRIAEEERRLKEERDAAQAADEIKCVERVAEIDFGDFSFGSWGSPAPAVKPAPKPSVKKVPPIVSVRKDKIQSRKDRSDNNASEKKKRPSKGLFSWGQGSKTNIVQKSVSEKATNNNASIKDVKKTKQTKTAVVDPPKSENVTQKDPADPHATQSFSIRNKKKKAPPPTATKTLERKATLQNKEPPPVLPRTATLTRPSKDDKRDTTMLRNATLMKKPLDGNATIKTAPKIEVATAPTPVAQSTPKPVEEIQNPVSASQPPTKPAAAAPKPGEPRRRKLVRGANAVVAPVLPEFKAAMDALDDLMAFLDVQLSSDVILAEDSVKKETSFKLKQAAIRASVKGTERTQLTHSIVPKTVIPTSETGISALSNVLLIGEKSPQKQRNSQPNIEPVPVEIAEKFSKGALEMRAATMKEQSENVDPKLRSGKLSMRAKTQPVEIKGYALTAENILSMDEAERIALLDRVKKGSMSIDEALNEVIEHQRRQNCTIM